MSWSSSVQAVGKWYESNIHNYNQGQYTQCNIVNTGKVRHDCSGYVSACLRAAGILKPSQIFRSGDYAGGSASSILKKAGFVQMRYSVSAVQAYDIIAYDGHVEIYAGKINGSMRSWSWGSCHDGKNGHAGMPAYTASKNRYTTIWRMGGTGPGNASDYVPVDNSVQPTTTGGGDATGGGNGGAGGAGGAAANTSADQSIFSDAMSNGMQPTMTNQAQDREHTRIYSAAAPTITVDELSMPMDEGTINNGTQTTNN